MEHRWIWTKNKGEISKEELVHHINGNRLDNKIENLTLLDNSIHQKLHWRKRKNVSGN